jgi:hypothetical protein
MPQGAASSSFKSDSRRKRISRGLSAIDAMDEFDEVDSRECRFLITRPFSVIEQLINCDALLDWTQEAMRAWNS